MAKTSAGLLLYRRHGDAWQVLLVHPGGPFWARKDEGVWSIPKGEYVAGEDPLAAAKREFIEETGSEVDGEFQPLGDVRQASGKIVSAWAVEGDLDAASIQSNTVTMEWPPRSGRTIEFPEVDRAEWFPIEQAARKLLQAQLPLLDRLAKLLAR